MDGRRMNDDTGVRLIPGSHPPYSLAAGLLTEDCHPAHLLRLESNGIRAEHIPSQWPVRVGFTPTSLSCQQGLFKQIDFIAYSGFQSSVIWKNGDSPHSLSALRIQHTLFVTARLMRFSNMAGTVPIFGNDLVFRFFPERIVPCGKKEFGYFLDRSRCDACGSVTD